MCLLTLILRDPGRLATSPISTLFVRQLLFPRLPHGHAARFSSRYSAARGLWDDLAAADPVKADVAARLLGARTDLAVPLFRLDLKPIPKADPVQLAKLIAGLGAERFADREAAEREVAALGDAARPALVAALAGPSSAEVRRRLGPLLVRLDAETLSGERLRGVRAVEVLEQAGSADAHRLLRDLVGGEPGRLTDEATAALGRLGRPR